LGTSGSWEDTLPMDSPRQGGWGRLLLDGRVLVMGGCHSEGSRRPCLPVARVEIYDPKSGAWSRTQSMIELRSSFTPVVLHDGRVLVTGGSTTAELYDPETETWRYTTPMGMPRWGLGGSCAYVSCRSRRMRRRAPMC
jgi:hypothetical protein